MKITTVRHGETIENAKQIVQGQVFGTLSELGLEQIGQVGLELGSRKFDVCISSDLERCRLTTEAILRHHADLQVYFDVRLRERSMKPMEGMRFAEVEGWDWENDKFLNHKTPEGESWSDVVSRVSDCLNELYGKFPDRHILIVSHGGPIRTMLALLRGEAWEMAGRTSLENCEIREWNMTAPVDASSVR